LSRAVLRPIMEDEQQIMEYYLPREDDLDRLDGAFDIPIGPEELQQIRVLGEEDGSSPQIDAIFPVSC